MTQATKPNVFIIESLTQDDEKHERFEGRILKQMLSLSGKSSIYCYIRTRRELEEFAKQFGQSGFRYLHLSCHANAAEMATTFDTVSFQDLGTMLRPHLEGRRVFLSACEMATPQLSRELITGSGCYSVIGPSEAVRFSDAALLWFSFYHLAFTTNDTVMQRKWMLAHLRGTAQLFGVRLNYFSASQRRGIRSTKVAPRVVT